MAAEDFLEVAFKQLRRDFTTKTKRSFLNDIQGQIEEDERTLEIMRKPRIKERYATFHMAISILSLVALDALSGGSGIYKPSNQMRALQWNSRRSDLLRVLRYFARNNAQVRFRRALVLPFPIPPIGHRIDTDIHMR